MEIKHLLNNPCFCLSILQDALSWYTFDAAFVISNSAIAKKKVEVEDKGGNHALFEQAFNAFLGWVCLYVSPCVRPPADNVGGVIY